MQTSYSTLECREDSAFYVAHYIKWFDGDKLTFVIDEVRAQIIAFLNLHICS